LITFTGDVIDRAAGSTPAADGPAQIVRFLGGLAQTVLSRLPGSMTVAGIGISAGAPAEGRRGLVFPAPNLPNWDEAGFALAERLAEEIGLSIPTALENDADATALAEHRFGAGQGAENMAFITVGTGVGAGLIIDGKLLRGAFGAGGEVGHIMVESEGRLCVCGLRGCLEAYSSGPSLVRLAVERGFAGDPTGVAVVAAARDGDAAALSATQTAGRMLGRGIATLAMLLNPEVVVLGTLAVHAGDLLLPEIEREVAAGTWPRLRQSLKIVPAALADRAQDLAALCAFLEKYPDAAAG
jgi:glucokinase